MKKTFLVLLCLIQGLSLKLFQENTLHAAEHSDGFEKGQLSDIGFDQQSEAKLLKYLNESTVLSNDKVQKKEIHSMLIYSRKKLVFEKYFSGNNDYIEFKNPVTRQQSKTQPVRSWSQSDKHYAASVNKSFTSAIVGLVLAETRTNLDYKIKNCLPGYADFFFDKNKEKITIEDALTMRLGFTWDEWGSNDLDLLWGSNDFTKFLLTRTNTGSGHSESWRYNSAGPNMLLTCMEYLVGGAIRQWAHKNFFQKLAITDYTWGSQPSGTPEGSAILELRPRDMLKFGVTFLDRGKWQGQQVLPKNFVDSVFNKKVSGSAGLYSYLFWQKQFNEVAYLSANGDGGQYINIFPSLDLVIVVTQGNYLDWPFYDHRMNEIMELVIPVVKRGLKTP